MFSESTQYRTVHEYCTVLYTVQCTAQYCIVIVTILYVQYCAIKYSNILQVLELCTICVYVTICNAAAVRAPEPSVDRLPGRDGVPLSAHQQHREPRAVRQSVYTTSVLYSVL